MISKTKRLAGLFTSVALLMGLGFTVSNQKEGLKAEAISTLHKSFNFIDGGSSSNNAYANTDLATDVGYAADNPGGTSGTTAWEADYANLSLTTATRLGGKLVSTVQTDNTTAWANIKTIFKFDPIIEKVEVIGLGAFGTASKWTETYLQSSLDSVTWTTQATSTAKSGTITFDSMTIPALSYLRLGIALTASGSNSGMAFTGIKVYEKQASSVSVTGITFDKTSSPTGGFYVGQTDQITASVVPSNATNKTINWTTSDAAVATISSNGLVTAVGAGTATITGTTEEGPFSEEYSATVIALVLNNITIKTAATKTTFKVGESFNTNGLVINANYNSGTVEVTSGFTTNLDSKVFTTGDIATGVVVTVTLEGKTVTYTIDVEAAPLAVQDLFFSEYVEGSSSNKYLEIYNPLSTSVNLANYAIRQYNNGATTPTYTLTLSGTLAPFDTYVIKNSAESLNVTADLSTNSSVMNFNGDDTLTIYNGSIEVDIFGQIGNDPGTFWGTGDFVTAEKTLVRKPSITRGDQVGGDSFDPADEWDSYSQNTITYLGDAANGAYVLAEYLMASDTADQCVTKFTIAKNDYFLKLSSASATLFQNGTETTLVSARARYLAWAANQKSNPYSATPLSGITIANNNFENNQRYKIMFISLLGISILAGFYFSNKKKAISK